MNWIEFNDLAELQDDKNYLVAWRNCDGKYSTYHRAYYIAEEKKFFSLENNNSHPLHVDVFLQTPNIDYMLDKK